jgi:hypothetical protein
MRCSDYPDTCVQCINSGLAAKIVPMIPETFGALPWRNSTRQRQLHFEISFAVYRQTPAGPARHTAWASPTHLPVPIIPGTRFATQDSEFFAVFSPFGRWEQEKASDLPFNKYAFLVSDPF